MSSGRIHSFTRIKWTFSSMWHFPNHIICGILGEMFMEGFCLKLQSNFKRKNQETYFSIWR